MKKIGSAAIDGEILSKIERNRRYLWCRLHNGFLDDPLFRVIADMSGRPLYQVIAFVARLESVANQGDPRGYVGDIRPAEFAAALGMPLEDVQAIYDALVHPEIGWIDQEHVAGFYGRNRDKEDLGAANRQRRKRARRDVRRELSRRQKLGAISAEQRDSVEAVLDTFEDDQLYELKSKLRRGAALEAALLSTGHALSRRDSVTVTPRADQKIKEEVENSGSSAWGEKEAAEKGSDAAGDLPTGHGVTAEQWISGDGKRLVIERLQIQPVLAETYIERWRRDLPNAEALKKIIEGADNSGYVGARFHTIITDQVKRSRHLAEHGPQLPIGPAVISGSVRKVANG